jgi:hypothetical protein
MTIDIVATIKGIKYKPLLCRELETVEYEDFESALAEKSSFLLEINKKDKVAISWWVSSKRTRSYPYARVYDTLGFTGKKVTVIPVYKDEGLQGDRDFIQWDTISLMSLLDVYVIIAYYARTEKSKRYDHKITNQRFDIDYINEELRNIFSYQSNALHWNLEHLNNIGNIAKKAYDSYEEISKHLGVNMHSWKTAAKKISDFQQEKQLFMRRSRDLSKLAQLRERLTLQPKERLIGKKAIITISNYQGGNYYLTADEARINGNQIKLIEAKHSENNSLPSEEDIKDGLIKMMLFTNLDDVIVEKKKYYPLPVLKLTCKNGFSISNLTKRQGEIFAKLQEEAKKNNFDLSV